MSNDEQPPAAANNGGSSATPSFDLNFRGAQTTPRQATGANTRAPVNPFAADYSQNREIADLKAKVKGLEGQLARADGQVATAKRRAAEERSKADFEEGQKKLVQKQRQEERAGFQPALEETKNALATEQKAHALLKKDFSQLTVKHRKCEKQQQQFMAASG